MKSIESALGYASVELDLSRVIYPKTEEDRWEKIVKEFASNLGTYWQPFSGAMRYHGFHLRFQNPHLPELTLRGRKKRATPSP